MEIKQLYCRDEICKSRLQEITDLNYLLTFTIEINYTQLNT